MSSFQEQQQIEAYKESGKNDPCTEKIQATVTACQRDQTSDLSKKGLKVAIIDMFTDIKELTIKVVKEDTMAVSHQIENISKEKEVFFKRNQMEITELKSKMTEIKKIRLRALTVDLNWQNKKWICGEIGITQVEEQREKWIKNSEQGFRGMWDTVKCTNICVTETPEEERSRKNMQGNNSCKHHEFIEKQ